MAWSPEQYLKFADERSRPARDLIAQIAWATPRLIYDLGCGPGNSTQLLAEAWPDAKIIGVDNSDEMLARARETLPHLTFHNIDVARFDSPPDVDVLFSNATFQWVPQHGPILQRLLRGLKPGGILAVQMPDNLDAPSHAAMRRVAANGPWAEKLARVNVVREKILTPLEYYNLLKPHAAVLEIWHTAYNHPLNGVSGIVDMISSTGLRPFLDPLASDEKVAFVEAYRTELSKQYVPAIDGKVLLQFNRIFIVAQAISPNS